MKKFIILFMTIFTIVLSGCADYTFTGTESRFYVKTSTDIFACEDDKKIIEHIEFLTQFVSRFEAVKIIKLEKSSVSTNYEGFILINKQLYIIKVIQINYFYGKKGTEIEYALLEKDNDKKWSFKYFIY